MDGHRGALQNSRWTGKGQVFESKCCVKICLVKGRHWEKLYVAYFALCQTALDAGQFDVSTHDPHTIGGCLKMYLRELPDPLLTYDLYSEWMKAG